MPGESILTPIQRSVGVSAIKDSIYKEIEFRKETIMNEVIKAGEVFKLAEFLPYQEGKIVNISLPKYLANFPNFTGIPACSLVK